MARAALGRLHSLDMFAEVSAQYIYVLKVRTLEMDAKRRFLDDLCNSSEVINC